MRLGRRARYLLLGVIGVVACSVVWAWLDELGKPVGLPPFEPGGCGRPRRRATPRERLKRNE